MAKKSSDRPESVKNFGFDKASAPSLQQTKSVSEQPMREHLGDADSCKDGVFNRLRCNRVPYGYDGIESTNRNMRTLLPRLLGQIGEMHRERPDLILASWPEIVGNKLAPMTKAISFEAGILYIKVNNSTLYSLLSQHERGRLLKCLRDRFPAVEFKNIVFRLG